MIDVTVQVFGARQMREKLSGMEERADDLRGAWPAVERVFAWSVRRQFSTEGGHGGRQWAPLTARTVAERLRLGYGGTHPVLRRTDTLYNSLVNPRDRNAIRIRTRNRLVIWTRVKYAKVHQKGSRDGRIPARPMVALNTHERRQVSEAITRYVAGGRRVNLGRFAAD